MQRKAYKAGEAVAFIKTLIRHLPDPDSAEIQT